jgi:hypothetical protein
MPFGLEPFSHGASQKGVFFPLPTTIAIEAYKRFMSTSMQGFPNTVQNFSDPSTQAKATATLGPLKISKCFEIQVPQALWSGKSFPNLFFIGIP